MNSTVHVDEVAHDKFLAIDLHGTLNQGDYERFVPETERMILQNGKIRILVTMHDFQGWSAGALWEDVKWDVKHPRAVGAHAEWKVESDGTRMLAIIAGAGGRRFDGLITRLS